MVRNFWKIILLLLVVPVCAFAQNQGWKHIDSEYYSLDIPERWVPYTNDNDGITLSKRTVDDIEYAVLAWMNGAQTFDEYEDVQIQSVEQKNGENLSLKEGKALIYDKKKPRTKTYFKSDDEICFKSVYETTDGFGNSNSWTSICYYKYDGKRYYKLHCNSRTARFKTEKDLEERYLHIIRSFKLKTE